MRRVIRWRTRAWIRGLIKAHLGHADIRHTGRYTELNPKPLALVSCCAFSIISEHSCFQHENTLAHVAELGVTPRQQIASFEPFQNWTPAAQKSRTSSRQILHFDASITVAERIKCAIRREEWHANVGRAVSFCPRERGPPQRRYSRRFHFRLILTSFVMHNV